MIDLQGPRSTFLDTLEEESILSRDDFSRDDFSRNYNHNDDDDASSEVTPFSGQNSQTTATSKSRLSNGSTGNDIMEDISLFEEISNRSGSTRTNISGDGSSRRIIKHRSSSTMNLMNIHQTLEWRGLLSACFLFYQLTSADYYSVSPINSNINTYDNNEDRINIYYNISRVGISCFMFLTGYGHAMYFYARNNYCSGRLFQVLFRLNLSAFFLCAAMNRPYILYYACPLHTMAFLVTYGILKFQHHNLNYQQRYGLRFKLIFLAILIFVVWDLNTGLFDLLFTPFFSRTGTAAVPDGPLWEWYYHSHLHHWIMFAGIVFAVNYPVTTLLLQKMETLPHWYLIHLVKGITGLFFLVALWIFIKGPFLSAKYSFDSTHPYFTFLPVLAYIYFRNINSYMRQRHIKALKTIGKFSLEIFIFHHYFFLADHGNAVLVLVPGYPKCNVVVTALLLLLVARTTHNLTVILSAMMFPADDDNKSIRSLATFFVTVLGFYCLAFTFNAVDLVGPATVTVGIILLGILLYKAIIDATWTEYKNVGRQLAGVEENESVIAEVSPPIIGALVVMVLGISWYIVSVAGASGGGHPPLPKLCENYVNDGMWVPVTACSEYQRGHDTRDLDMGAYYRDCDLDGSGGAALHWGWKRTKPNLKCQFRSRNTVEMRNKLSHRMVVFIGDEMVRNLFHALCRLLGDTEAGMYDSSEAVHSEINKVFGTIRMEYKWAPLAYEQVAKMKDIRMKGNAGLKGPDLIVVGGGALDRLHVWATDEDQESLNVAVQNLAKELDFSSATATVWCTPTTVNTPALNTDEKRNQMNEMAVSEVRKMYAELDVESSANFVLEGPAYTMGRVSESYDGRLYPRPVYDVGIQIIANGLDWLLPSSSGTTTTDTMMEEENGTFDPPATGVLSHPYFGLMMLLFGSIGLFFFDGYLGFSYLSSLLVRIISSSSYYSSTEEEQPETNFLDEAYGLYHQRLKLPAMRESKKRSKNSGNNRMNTTQEDSDLLSLLENDSLTRDGSGRSSNGSRRRSNKR